MGGLSSRRSDARLSRSVFGDEDIARRVEVCRLCRARLRLARKRLSVEQMM